MGLFNAMPARGVPAAFWPHSLATAVCSEVILQHVATSPAAADPDVVFLGALLHDLGLLVLASHYPNDYQAFRETSVREAKPLIDVEVAVLGIDHATMGAQLAKQWLFPPSVCAAIRGHHRIGTVEPEHRWNTLVVHLAESLSSQANIAGMDEVLQPDRSWIAEMMRRQMNDRRRALDFRLENARNIASSSIERDIPPVRRRELGLSSQS